MSLFGSTNDKASSSSLFGSLGLDSTTPINSAKRGSIFEPNTTTQARSQSQSSSDAPAGQSASTSSMSFFGKPSTTSAGTTGSLFPATTTGTGSTNTGGGLFGSLNTNPSSNAAQSSSPSLFGGQTTAGTASTKPAPPSLFGGLSPSVNPPSASGGPGLFGITSNSSKPSALHSFGTNPSTIAGTGASPFGPASAQSAGNTSLFGGSTAANTAFSAAPSTTPSNLSQSQFSRSINREAGQFSSLLERHKKRVKFDNVKAADLDGMGHLPSMSMDIADITRKAQEMGQKERPAAKGPIPGDSRAHYILSGSGVRPGQAYSDFAQLGSRSTMTVTPVSAPYAPDSAQEGRDYMEGLRTKGREAMLRETMDRVYRDVDILIDEGLGIDFEEQKRRIMQHLGLLPRGNSEIGTGSPITGLNQQSTSLGRSGMRSVFGKSGMGTSIIGNTSSIRDSVSRTGSNAQSRFASPRDMRDKERHFTQKVEALNKNRVSLIQQPQDESQPFRVLQEFADVEKTVGGDIPKQLLDAYGALQEITEENVPNKRLQERCYKTAHLDGDDQTTTLQLKKRILRGSRRYLEKAFYQEIEQIVAKNAMVAQVGGQPTVINKVRAYIRVRADRHDLAPDGTELNQSGETKDYPWALVFYMLRCGHVQDAVQYVRSDPIFQTSDKRFVSYLKVYSESPDGRLSKKLQDMIEGEYQQRARNAPKGTVDPYRMACYKVIGRCDLSQRNLDQIGQGVEDWLWLQFCLAREVESAEDAAGQIFGLEQIVETVAEIGQKHFAKVEPDGSNSYGTYFLMQILAGMFEQAVDYLHHYNPTSAVHVAIALTYYGLLRPADYTTAGNDLLTHSTTQYAQINFVPLVARYTATFRTAMPVAATDYLCLLNLNADLLPPQIGHIHTSATHESLRELCLETREFAALLGDLRNDGQAILGAIEKRRSLLSLNTHEQFLKHITSQSAVVADSRGQITDAVLLYHLCDDYNSVVTVLNRVLAEAVAVPLGDAPISLQPLKPRSELSTSDSASTNSASTLQGSSFSLVQSTNNPLQLAQKISVLYGTNASYFSKITDINRNTLRILLIMLSARAKIEAENPEYLKALEELNSTGVLPLDVGGDISEIRQMAQNFGALPSTVVRCAGIVIIWAIRSVGAERDRLDREGSWSVSGGTNHGETLKTQLGQMARDLMVFSGLVKYKLPGRVYEMLTTVGADVGAY